MQAADERPAATADGVRSASTAEPPPDRADRWERRFTTPVVVAALASVPATFLTMLDGTAATFGHAVNYLSLAVFAAEATILFALAGDRLAWMRRHKVPILVTLATVPAVVFAVGPVQVLRVLRFVRVLGALRILRVGRILRAGRILRERAGLEGRAAKVSVGLASALAAVFVALVLADPSSTTRRFLDDTAGNLGLPAVILAGVLLGGATFVVLRYRSGRGQARKPRLSRD